MSVGYTAHAITLAKYGRRVRPFNLFGRGEGKFFEPTGFTEDVGDGWLRHKSQKISLAPEEMGWVCVVMIYCGDTLCYQARVVVNDRIICKHHGTRDENGRYDGVKLTSLEDACAEAVAIGIQVGIFRLEDKDEQ